jgi:hypothetical protein
LLFCLTCLHCSCVLGRDAPLHHILYELDKVVVVEILKVTVKCLRLSDLNLSFSKLSWRKSARYLAREKISARSLAMKSSLLASRTCSFCFISFARTISAQAVLMLLTCASMNRFAAVYHWADRTCSSITSLSTLVISSGLSSCNLKACGASHEYKLRMNVMLAS